MPSVNVMEFGAKGDGTGNDAAAIQKAIDACAAGGGGRVVVPAGREFSCGPVELRSGIELHLEHASRLVAIPDRSVYPEETLRILGGDGRKWLHATGASNVAITGTGVIDGRGVAFMTEEKPTIFKTAPGRPFGLHLENCTVVTLRDVTFHDAPFWTVHLMGCRDVQVVGVRIDNHPKVPNTDGIDVNRCRNVRIVGCTVSGGDDAICIKSEHEGSEYGECADIVVSACTLQSTSCAIKVGSGTAGEIRRIVFSGCSIYSSHRGLGIQMRDEGLVEDILFADMTVQTRYESDAWWGDATPIYVTVMQRSADSKLGHVRGVRFSNIRCRGENGVLIAGASPEHLEQIELENVDVQIEPSQREAGKYDLRPCVQRPALMEGPTDGFHLWGARDVTLRNCSVRWPQAVSPWHRHAVYARDCPGLRIEGETGESADPQRLKAVEML